MSQSARIVREAYVPYGADQMFALVQAVEAYPLFLPWCRAVLIELRTEEEIRACVNVVWGAFKQSFTTRNTWVLNQRIMMTLVQGPFLHFKGEWRFSALGEGGAHVILEMDFAFKNRLMDLTLGRVFEQIAGDMVDAFRQRAEVIYGKA